MPINKFVILGEFNNQSSFWKKADWDILHSEKGKRKLYKNFERHSIFFNLVFNFVSKYNNEYYKSIKKDNEITIVLNSNSNPKERYIPLSSWILFHRIGHCIQYNNKEYSFFNEKDLNFPYLIMEIVNPNISNNFPFGYFLGNLLLTMSSARKGLIQTNLDIFAEIFSQFMMTGKIKFNRINDCSFFNRIDQPFLQGVINHKEENILNIKNLMERKQSQIDKFIADLEIKYNKLIPIILNKMNRKILQY